MTKTVRATAAALFAAATLFTSAAEACISCEYVPEVVNTPVKGQTYRKKQVAVAKPPQVSRPKKRIAKPAPVIKKVETAKAEPIATPEPVVARAERPLSTATLLETGPAPREKPETVADLGCTKFFAAIGQTVTVPCE